MRCMRCDDTARCKVNESVVTLSSSGKKLVEFLQGCLALYIYLHSRDPNCFRHLVKKKSFRERRVFVSE